jgi:DNA-binding beta-propeller fold protein YncE
MWVTNSAGHTVTKLRASDGEIVETIAVGKGPRAVVFDGSRIWVGNYLGNSVTRIEVE